MQEKKNILAKKYAYPVINRIFLQKKINRSEQDNLSVTSAEKKRVCRTVRHTLIIKRIIKEFCYLMTTFLPPMM